ncbi:MAG: gamma carbonic anhydrase family protein [Spirochaetales bacterium]
MTRDDPKTNQAAFIAPSASITGQVFLGRDASIWHNVTLRGDLAPVEIGARSNIQDGAILHVATNLPCIVGDDVTVGHGAIVHGCKVGNRCLIGMGAIILNGAEIGDECIIGAGALVTEGKKIPSRSLVLGSPAKVTRQISETELRQILENAASYRELASRARTDSTTMDC